MSTVGLAVGGATDADDVCPVDALRRDTRRLADHLRALESQLRPGLDADRRVRVSRALDTVRDGVATAVIAAGLVCAGGGDAR